MIYGFLKEAIHRHFDETDVIIQQLTDEVILKEPVKSGRPLGEIVLHIIRSLEYYSQGLANDVWEPLIYTLEKYPTANDMIRLYADVVMRVKSYLTSISPESLNEEYTQGNRSATKAEVLLELLEHSIQHRGQLLVYYRLLGIVPKEIPYII